MEFKHLSRRVSVSNYDQGNSEFQSIQHIIQFASKHPLLTPAEEYALLYRYKESVCLMTLAATSTNYEEVKITCLKEQRDIKTELLNRNLKLIIKEAKKYIGRGLPLEDLIQEGSTGLLRAIEKFEIERGNKLSTYAVRWIQQRIGRALENKSRLVKIPANILGQINELKRKYKDFTELENRPPSAEEIAEILNIPTERAKELGRLLYSSVSLDETVGEDENLSMINYVVDNHTTSSEEKCENKADKGYIQELLKDIPEEDAKFVKLKYGFFDNKERTDKEMSQLLKISLKEIREKDAIILTKLRERADISKVNTNIQTNLILNSFGPEPNQVVEHIIKMTRLSIPQINKMVLPSPICFNITQHLADQYKKELERRGASVSIVSFNV
jgi:RNA polymerase sigma factor (sigma-70 family)